MIGMTKDAAFREVEAAGDAAEQVYIDADRELTVVSMSSRAKRELGSVRSGRSVLGLLSASEAFRLERFVTAPSGKGVPGHLELSFQSLPGHNYAYAVRQGVLSGAAVRIWLFADRGELLASPPVLAGFGRVTDAYSDASEALSAATEVLDRVAQYDPADAAELKGYMMRLYMTGMTAAIVQSIRGTGTAYHEPFDLKEATDTAMGLVTESEKAVTYRGTGEKKCRFPARVTFENYLYLVTSAVSSVRAIPQSGNTLCEAVFGEERLDFELSAKVDVPHLAIRPGMGMMALEELCPASSARLFICDVICSECGIVPSVSEEEGTVRVRFSVEKCPDAAEFKSRAHVPEAQVVMQICRGIILGLG